MTYRKTFFVVLVLLCVLLASGATLAQGPVTVVIYVGLGTGTAPEQISAQEALAERFNAEHDDLQIEFMIAPHEEADTRLLAMLTDASTAPGLVGPMGVDFVSALQDAWADITPLIEAEGYDLSDFYPAAVELLTVNDENKGLPLGLYPSFLLYNVDLFDGAGVDYPPDDYADTSWTFDELRNRAMLLTLDENYNDATMDEFDPEAIIQYGFDDSWINLRGRLAGWSAEFAGRPTNDDYTIALANSPEWVAGLQWFSDGMHVDHFIPDAAGVAAYEATGSGTPLDGGIIAIFHSHTWYLAEIAGFYDELTFEVQLAPVPFAPNGTRTARIHADVFAIPEIYPNQDAAWEVMKWLESEDNIVEVCMIYGCIPGRLSAVEEHRAIMEEFFPGLNMDVVYEAINYLDNPHHESWTPEASRVEGILEFAYEQVFYGENLDAQAVLDAANAEIQTILDEYSGQ